MFIALILLSAIIIYLTALVRQRLSVPELSKQKYINSLVLFFGFISVGSLLMIYILNSFSLNFSKKFNFVDNLFNIIFMLSAFIFCYLSFNLLNLSFKEKPLDLIYFSYKKIILIGMFIQKDLYMFNFVLISSYVPIVYTEKILISLMILIININCVLFHLFFALFIYTLKYDLFHVNLQLEIIPDLEFFMDANKEEFSVKKKMEKIL